MHSADALVIGAGAAGLAAAAALGDAGLRVTVLEARERIGGRIHTLHLPEFPLPIELGAEFVHGSPAETAGLMEQAGLAAYEVSDRHQRFIGGRLVEADDFWSEMNRVLERIDTRRPDASFADFLLHDAADAGLADGRRLAARYVEGFHAADLAEVSTHAVAEAEGGSASGNSGMRRILNGYAAVVGELHRAAAAGGVELRLGHAVKSIRWERGTVTVEAVDGEGTARRFSAARAVVTLPLPILQDAAARRGKVVIDPLPADWSQALGGLRMGSVVRTVLQFRRRFWDPETSFVHHPESPWWQLWWTSAPIDSPMLTGWCGGPPARRLGTLGRDALVGRAVEQLAELFDTPVPRVAELLVRGDTHDWDADPWSRGAYTYVAAGGAGSAERLSEPADGTLVIAGEAAAPPGRHGTVDGAIASARRAVSRLTAQA